MLIKAPAKINIGLRILSKRDDGYHNLETIFYPVKLYDELFVQIRKSDAGTNSIIIRTEKNSVHLNKNNTCFKAVQSFFKAFRIKDNYKLEIKLRKNIPIGGGLGGGSSDAGAVLRFLVKYFNINITAEKEKLIQCALEVGSDVPFFLVQKPCYATGKGEYLQLLNNFILNYDILLVNPNQHVSTKLAYESLGLSNDYVKNQVLNKVTEFNLENIEYFVNDFEKVVFPIYPILEKIKDDLYKRGAVFSSMSGSGAVIYGFFDRSDKDKLNYAVKEYRMSGYFTAIA
ncbi:MAG: 4-(cytidine 5'-diphospho)-2-C-methyl-D-erythritol kinase [Ignavibacteria bacterium]